MTRLTLFPFLRISLAVLAAMIASACEPVQEDVEDALDIDDDDDDDDDGDAGDADALDFGAALSGAAERPNPVPTTMSGDASVMVAEDLSSLDYTVNVEDGDEVIAAHIHLGGPEEAGPVVVTLFSTADPMDVDGELASGSASDDDLEGPLAGGTIEDLLDEMRAGNTYVNVHTVQYPDGEVRGQLDE